MKKFIALLFAAIFILSPFMANSYKVDEKAIIKFYYFNEYGIFAEEQRISLEKAEKVEKAFLLLRNGLLHCNWHLTIIALTYLRGLGLFLYLLDEIEDIVDEFFTPATKASLFAHIFSYGHGCLYIPFYNVPIGHALFFGMILRPIYWKFNSLSYTLVRKCHLIPPRIDIWDAIGRQEGFMLGFYGIYIEINRPCLPDTYIMLGRCGLLIQNDLLL